MLSVIWLPPPRGACAPRVPSGCDRIITYRLYHVYASVEDNITPSVRGDRLEGGELGYAGRYGMLLTAGGASSTQHLSKQPRIAYG